MEIQEQLSGQQYPRLETPVSGKTQQPTGLTEVLKIIPDGCYDNPTARGVAWIVRDFAIFAAATFGLVQAEGFWLVPLWLLAGLSISSLFILGHDAAHDTLFKSKKLNYVLGQLAMLLRAQTLVDVDCWTRVPGQPLRPGQIHEAIRNKLTKIGEKEATPS